MSGFPSQRIQCDEIWSFVGAKMKNVNDEQVAQGWGDVWTWTAIDADSKLIVSYLVGQRGPRWAKLFMEDVASRVTSRIQLTTDGLRMYAEAVEGAFGCDVDYAMLVKLYGNDSFDTKYSPGECIGTQTAILQGNPDPKHISTSFVERQNLTMRMSMRRFTRLTNGFSKKLANHEYQVALYFFHYNFCRIHKTLRVTPAMEAGLTNHVWTLEDLYPAILGRHDVFHLQVTVDKTGCVRGGESVGHLRCDVEEFAEGNGLAGKKRTQRRSLDQLADFVLPVRVYDEVIDGDNVRVIKRIAGSVTIETK